MDKKGIDFGLSIYLVPAMFLLVLILIFYVIVFFVLGVAKAPDLTIRSESLSDSSKLNVLLTSPIEGYGDVSDFIINNHDSVDYKRFNEIIKPKLNNFPKPEYKNAFWNLIIEREDKKIFSIEASTIGASDYNKQYIYLPTKDKSLIKITLFLNCFDCGNKEVAKS